MKRIHIVGCHRSGTTLLAELVGNCFDIDGRIAHEQALWVPVPAAHELFLTKKPPDTIRIKWAFKLDPQLYVIAMIRDPRGVITSRHVVKPDVYFSSFWRWEKYLQAIHELADHPRFLVVRYEDLVDDPDQVQQAIADAFPFLEQTSRFSTFPEGADVTEIAQSSLNGLRSIDRASLERWRDELPRIKGELDRHPSMLRWLMELGYEPDDAWTGCLQGVEPSYGDYKNEQPHIFRRTEANVRFAWKTLRYVISRFLQSLRGSSRQPT